MVNKYFSHLKIMEDFNYPAFDWENSVSSGSAMEQDTYRDYFLWQQVTLPTRYRALQVVVCSNRNFGSVSVLKNRPNFISENVFYRFTNKICVGFQFTPTPSGQQSLPKLHSKFQLNLLNDEYWWRHCLFLVGNGRLNKMFNKVWNLKQLLP